MKLYKNDTEATYTKEAYLARRKILKALATAYPDVRKTCTRSQFQHLCIEAIAGIGIHETLFNKTPAAAIKAAALMSHGDE